MKDCCIFTIVKNEKFFLPIWLEYYKRFFESEDIFILNHDSDDGCVDDLDVNVVNIHNDLAFDHSWLLSTVKNFQQKLLETYKICIFVEVDEILLSGDLDFNYMIEDFLNSECSVITCRGYEVFHEYETEPNVKNLEDIKKNRMYFYRESSYDKTLISKIPINWTFGFHESLNVERNFSYDLILLHLHKIDIDYLINRQIERSKWKFSGDGMGNQNKLTDAEEVKKWFHLRNTHNGVTSGPNEIIPERYKNKL